MIKRIWHGWTDPGMADTYAHVLTTQVIPGIEAKSIPGYLGIEVLRRNLETEVEFITIMSFRSLDDIIARTVLESTRGARAFYHTVIERGGEVLAEVKSSWCCIDAESLRPARIGEEIARHFFPSVE